MELKHRPIELLDHGYIRLVETWGVGDAGVAEAGIIEAARQSTQGSFRGWDKDEKLLEHLYTHKHDSPFEFAGAVIEVQAPIMVFREWHRHRTQSYNEMSGRYTELPDLNYIPELDRIQAQSTTNKQGSEDTLSTVTKIDVQCLMRDITLDCRNIYNKLLALGVSRELARIILPVNQYSRMRAQANLRNWLAFMTLRRHPDAQWEIRQYAEALHTILQEQFPRTLALFDGV